MQHFVNAAYMKKSYLRSLDLCIWDFPRRI